jgi:hypothetical protein
MALRQHQPIVACMLDEPSAGLDQPLLQAGQRPAGDPRRQRQPPLQIAEIIGDNAQPQPHLIGPKAVTGKPRQRDRRCKHSVPADRRPGFPCSPYQALLEDQGGNDATSTVHQKSAHPAQFLKSLEPSERAHSELDNVERHEDVGLRGGLRCFNRLMSLSKSRTCPGSIPCRSTKSNHASG